MRCTSGPIRSKEAVRTQLSVVPAGGRATSGVLLHTRCSSWPDFSTCPKGCPDTWQDCLGEIHRRQNDQTIGTAMSWEQWRTLHPTTHASALEHASIFKDNQELERQIVQVLHTGHRCLRCGHPSVAKPKVNGEEVIAYGSHTLSKAEHWYWSSVRAAGKDDPTREACISWEKLFSSTAWPSQEFLQDQSVSNPEYRGPPTRTDLFPLTPCLQYVPPSI